MRFIITATTIFLLFAVGPVFADAPPYEDEDILGLELSGELLAPPSLVSQIGQDLAAIRFAFPEISDISVYPDWEPGSLLLGLTEDGWAEYLAGTFAELDSLNSEYGPVSVRPITFIECLALEYEVLYHPEVLAAIYEGIDGVSFANPNALFGDGSDIYTEQLSIYTFKRGWGDCPNGCQYNDFWVFSVIDGSVDLIDHYGDSVAAVEPDFAGQTGFIQGIAPNPFNPRTTIKFRLNQENWVSVKVYDLRGRPIIELLNEHVPPGDHELTWRGVDGSGAPVASGLYFCRLVVNGIAQVQEMTLLK